MSSRMRMTACWLCSCGAGSGFIFLPLVQGSSCRILQLWVIRRRAAALKYYQRFLLQQRCDLTLYYTGPDTSTSRMQRCPPLNLWFSAARASFPRDHLAVEVRYMDAAGLRQWRSARTGTGLRLRMRRGRNSPFWAGLALTEGAATFSPLPSLPTLAGGGTAACFSSWSEEKERKNKDWLIDYFKFQIWE